VAPEDCEKARPCRFLDVRGYLLYVGIATPSPTKQGHRRKQSKAPKSLCPTGPRARCLKAKQGAQQSQIKFKPATRQVTIKLHVEDPNGYFLPNLHPDNFVVYETEFDRRTWR